MDHECEQAAWKDMKAVYKVKAISNATPVPVAPPATSPTENWEFSEGCEGRRMIAYLLV